MSPAWAATSWIHFTSTLIRSNSTQAFTCVHFGKYHRRLSKKFPYGIYYLVEADTTLVRAVLDLRRDPEHIKRRLG